MFFGGKLEHKIRRKTLPVPFYLLVQMPDADPIKFGEVAIENDPVVAEDQNSRFDRYGDG